MLTIIDRIVAGALVLLSGAVTNLPLSFGQYFFAYIAWFIFNLDSHHRHVIRVNLEVAFPGISKRDRRRIIWGMCLSIGRLVVDICRLPRLDDSWMESHVEIPRRELLRSLVQRSPHGVLLASAHMGSFELLGQVLAYHIAPFSAVAREFSLTAVHDFWNARRELRGNEVINRRGGVRGILRALTRGRMVGVLMDQNVTRNNAVFAPFFGVPAATTSAMAILALRTGAPIVVITIVNLPADRYRVVWEECRYDDLKGETSDSVTLLTSRINTIIEDRIRAEPTQWFWMHRRWRTTVEEGAQSMYSSSQV